MHLSLTDLKHVPDNFNIPDCIDHQWQSKLSELADDHSVLGMF
jgi:hypothetical protein